MCAIDSFVNGVESVVGFSLATIWRKRQSSNKEGKTLKLKQSEAIISARLCSISRASG